MSVEALLKAHALFQNLLNAAPGQTPYYTSLRDEHLVDQGERNFSLLLLLRLLVMVYYRVPPSVDDEASDVQL